MQQRLETLSTIKDIAPFEAVHYVTEPVVTMAVEPKYSRDLPKLVELLRRLSLEDPNLVTKINEETGEYLIAGMGTLHLEIANTLITKTGLEIVTSKPIVIYRESIRGTAGPVEGKSPNKHNKIYLSVEPLPDKIISMLKGARLGNTKTNMKWQRYFARKDGPPTKPVGFGALTKEATCLWK